MKILCLAATAAALCAAPAAAQVMTPSDYVATAGASDLFERTSSTLILASTANPTVREFAAMMIPAHTQSSAIVKAAAMRSRVMVRPARLSPAQAEMIAQLRAESGAARDAVYIAQQRSAHGGALAVQKAYAEAGTAPALKAVAVRIVPVVEQHIVMLKAM